MILALESLYPNGIIAAISSSFGILRISFIADVFLGINVTPKISFSDKLNRIFSIQHHTEAKQFKSYILLLSLTCVFGLYITTNTSGAVSIILFCFGIASKYISLTRLSQP